MIKALGRPTTRFPSAAATADAPSRVAEVAAKWSTLPGGVVNGGEIMLFAIKPSMWRPVLESAPWLVTMSLLAVALTWLRTPIPGLSLAGTAQVALMVAVARLAFAVVRWVPSWYVLTNRRLIEIHGVRSPRIWACLLVEVRNTYVEVSSVDKCLGLGSIRFVTDHPNDLPHVWHCVAKPDQVHARIRRSIENAIDNYGITL